MSQALFEENIKIKIINTVHEQILIGTDLTANGIDVKGEHMLPRTIP